MDDQRRGGQGVRGRRVDAVRDGDHGTARRGRRPQAVARVLDRGTRSRLHPELGGRPPGRRPAPACPAEPPRWTASPRRRPSARPSAAPGRSGRGRTNWPVRAGRLRRAGGHSRPRPGSAAGPRGSAAAIRPSTSAATCSGVRGTPTSSPRWRDHSGVLMPIIRSWLSGRNCLPYPATYPRRTSSQTSSVSMMTPSRSKTTASIVTGPPPSEGLDGRDDLLGEHLELAVSQTLRTPPWPTEKPSSCSRLSSSMVSPTRSFGSPRSNRHIVVFSISS